MFDILLNKLKNWAWPWVHMFQQYEDTGSTPGNTTVNTTDLNPISSFTSELNKSSQLQYINNFPPPPSLHSSVSSQVNF